MSNKLPPSISRRRLLFAAFAVVIILNPPAASARPFRPDMIPNGNVFSCANCHNFPGGPRNAFGLAVEALVEEGEPTPFWSRTLAAKDSDGDGFTNGEELADPDGDGIPNSGVTVSNPGDANSTPDPENVAPFVNLTSPVSGAVLLASATTTVEATAADSDGTVANVEFFDGTASLGSDSTSPYSVAAALWLPGTHKLTAVATDNTGATTTSDVVTVTVQQDPHAPPHVDVTDRTFLPSTLTIHAGETVTWTSRSALNHTVTSIDGQWSPGNLTNGIGTTFEVKFTDPGTYEYLCAYHTTDTISSQRGSIVVLPADSTIASPTLRITRRSDASYLLEIRGTPATTYTIEYMENFGGAWITLGSATTDLIGQAEVADPSALGSLQRFYRSVYP